MGTTVYRASQKTAQLTIKSSNPDRKNCQAVDFQLLGNSSFSLFPSFSRNNTDVTMFQVKLLPDIADASSSRNYPKSPDLLHNLQVGALTLFRCYSVFPPNSLYDTFSGFHLSFGVGFSAGWPMAMTQSGIMVPGSLTAFDTAATRSSMG